MANIFHRESSSNLPTYVLTDHLPIEEGDILLGRITADPRSPTDEYRPADPRAALASNPESRFLEVIDTDFSTLLSATKNDTAKAKIAQIVRIDFEKLAQENHSLKSSFVRTRTLPQHRDALKALFDKHAQEIVELLRANKGKAYMAVGFKSCVNGKTGQKRNFSKKGKIKIEVPVDSIVTAATHGVVNPGKGLNIDAEGGKQQKEDATTRSTMLGDQIFAVRYRILTLQKTVQRTDDGKKIKGHTAGYGNILRVKFQNGIFSSSDSVEENFIFEDDLSDEEAVESKEEEDISLGDYLGDIESPNVIVEEFDYESVED